MSLVRMGTALYAACVDFMLRTAHLSGTTYRDTNALLLLVIFPVVTVVLTLVVIVQRARLARLRSRAVRG